MNKFTSFMRSKGFYVALGTGVVAFVAMLMVYNYSSTREEMGTKSTIDLNEPAVTEEGVENIGLEQVNNDSEVDVQDVAGDTDAEEAVVGNQMANDADVSEKTDEVSSDVAIADTEDGVDDETDNQEVATDDINDESSVPASSDATGVDFTEDTVLYTALEYDGAKQLVWPVSGNVILPYSMETTVYYQTLDSYKCNPGIIIEASEGTDVFAAYEGIVSSVEETKEYGTVVTITMGNGYEAKYGQLMNVCVAEGDMVSISQNIAEVGPVSSYFSKEGTNLYFQINKDDVPVNPMDLIK